MKVLLLVVPEESTFYMNKHIPPLAIGILQSYLRAKNHSVQSVDLSFRFKEFIKRENRKTWLPLFEKDYFSALINNEQHNESLEKIVAEILGEINFSGIDFIGISTGSGISIFELHFSILISKYITEMFNIPVALGGVNISHIYNFKGAFIELWLHIFKNIKYVFIGAGEVPFGKLLDAYENKIADNIYDKLEGAAYLKNNEVFANKESSPSLICPDFAEFNLLNYSTNLNPLDFQENIEHNFSWPFPYNVFAKDINNIKYKHTNYKEVFFPYYFNYHCPYNCAFCGQSARDKTGFCSKNAKTVLDDIQYLNKKHGAKYFHFVNNTFNYSPSFVKEFSEGIIKMKLEIYWGDCARIDNLTKELLVLMYSVGCRKLVFGFETGSKRLQKYINKNLDIDNLKQILIWCKEIGIFCDLEVIIGFPQEREEDFMDTYNFLFENRDLINFFYVNRYYVEPNSLMGTEPEKYNISLRMIQNYQSILEKNKKLFINQYRYGQKDIELSNLHIFSFNEIDGRKWNEINSTINEWFTKMLALQQSFQSITKAKEYIHF